MNLRNWHIVAGLIAAIVLIITSQSAISAPPNVVFILSDDQAYGDYGFMGHPHIQTPNLDRLAAESLTFTRGYVPTSLCRPSLATIVTGLYTHQHGIVGNDPPPPPTARNARGNVIHTHPDYLPIRDKYIDHMRGCDTICDRLAQLNYVSLQTGKWWEGNWNIGGFTEGMTHGDFLKGGRHGDDGLAIGREGLERIDLFFSDIKGKQHPFFLWYAPMMPHTPHNPPEDLLRKYIALAPTEPIAKYWAMCEWFDQTIGDLRALIDKHGFHENTMIVYVTDNGWINLPNQSAYAPRSKRSQYDGGLRTPIMISLPGQIKPRKDDDHLASSIDLVPTVLAACGLPADEKLPGINLLDEQALKARDSIFGGIFEHDIVDMDRPEASLMWRWIIHEDYKLIVPTQRVSAVVELYDVRKDPQESNNLVKSEPERVQQLLTLLDAWWKPDLQ